MTPKHPVIDTTVRAALRRVIFDVLRASYGPTAMMVSRAHADKPLPTERPAIPLIAAGVTLALANQLRRMAVDYIRDSRGAGSTWTEIADVLNLNTEWRPQEAAFEWAAGKSSLPFGHTAIRWTCASCGNRISDFGPECGPHPDDQEVGHSPGCRRHTADIRAYQHRSNRE